MDQGLFKKHFTTILQRKNKIDEVINYIQKQTNIELSLEEIVLEKNKISFQVSSVKKMQLQKNNISVLLQEKGYSVKL